MIILYFMIQSLVLLKLNPTPTSFPSGGGNGPCDSRKKGQLLPHDRSSSGEWPAASKCGCRDQASTLGGGCPQRGQRLLGHY